MTCETCQNANLARCNLQEYTDDAFWKIRGRKITLETAIEYIETTGPFNSCPFWIQIRDLLKVSIDKDENLIHQTHFSQTIDPTNKPRSVFLKNVSKPEDLADLPPEGKVEVSPGWVDSQFSKDDQTP